MKIRILAIVKFLIVAKILVFPSLVSAQTLRSPSENLNLNSLSIANLKVQGNTVFPQQKIKALYLPFLNKNLSYEQISQVAQKITDLYVKNGYLTSGAFFPQQEIVDGVAIIRIVEGKLERIEIEGIDEKYLLSRLDWNRQVPLNVYRLEEKLQFLQQDPLIKEIEAKLVEGSSLGQSVLSINVTEASPWTANLTFNNHNSPNSGELQGIASIANQNLFGFRDRLKVEYSLTDGFDAMDLSYSFPLNNKGSKLSIEYLEGDNEITQGSFNDFGIRADADTIRLEYDQSLFQELNHNASFFILLDKRTSNTFIEDDFPFSFTEGADEGRSRLTALRWGGSWTRRSESLVTSAQTQFSLGLDLFEPTINDDAPDALFFSWLGQFQLVKALNKKQDTLWVSKLAVQLSPDALLPFEQISIGGANTVRGYRENRGVGDNGILGTIELQLPLFQDSSVGDLKLIPFFDVGTIWDVGSDESLTLASIGIGIDWKIKEWFLIELDWGIPLTETSDLDDSLQDSGVHFQLHVQPF